MNKTDEQLPAGEEPYIELVPYRDGRTAIKRGGIVLECPEAQQHCSSACPFFEHQGRKKVQLTCRSRTLVLFAD